AIEATSKLIVGTAKQTVKFAFYLVSGVLFIVYAGLAYQHRANLQNSWNSIVSGSDALRPVQTRIQLGRLRTALMMYYLENHIYPADLNELVKREYVPAEEIRDQWGHELHYERLDSGYKIISSGLDGNFKTDDDID